MSMIKYGDAEEITMIKLTDVTDEEIKQKLDNLKEETIKQETSQVSQEIK